MKTKRINPHWIRVTALLALVAGLGFIASCAQPPPETIIIAGAGDIVGKYNGFFKDPDPATPASSSTLEISSPSGRDFTATLTITSGTDAPIAYVGEGTVSAGGIVSITAQYGNDTIVVDAEAATFDGGAATLDGTGTLERLNTVDLEGTIIVLRAFDFDPQNPPPSLDGITYRGIRIGDDGSEGPITVVLNQSPRSNTLTGQGAFGLSSPPPDATTAQDAEDLPLTWSVLGTVSNAGDVVWIAQTAEHRLQTVLQLPDGIELSGSYALHSFTKETGSMISCPCTDTGHHLTFCPLNNVRCCAAGCGPSSGG